MAMGTAMNMCFLRYMYIVLYDIYYIYIYCERERERERDIERERERERDDIVDVHIYNVFIQTRYKL